MIHKKGILYLKLSMIFIFLIGGFHVSALDLNVDDAYDQYPNPRTREVYNNYKRVSDYRLFDGNGNLVGTADQRSGRNFHVAGKWYDIYYMEGGRGKAVELIETDAMLTVNTDCPLYSEPYESDKYSLKKTLPKGTYHIKMANLDTYEIDEEEYKGYIIVPMNSTKIENTKTKLDVNSVHGIPVKQQIVNVNESIRPAFAMKPKYITIHNTGNYDRGSTARAHADIQSSRANNPTDTNYTSWHYTVDNNEIYQSLPMNEIGYHAGDVYGLGNASTIAIEICENMDGNYAQAEKNAVYLTAQLLWENNLPADAIKRHYDWSGKDCPKNMIHMTKGSMGWEGFKNAVKVEYDKIKENALEFDTVVPDELKPYVDTLNLYYVNNTVSGFKLSSNVKDIKDAFKSVNENVEIKICDKQQNEITETVKTGDKVYLKDNEKEFELTLIIRGDINGDGKITPSDYVIIRNRITKAVSLSMDSIIAADINKDQKISPVDYVMVRNHITGKSVIGG